MGDELDQIRAKRQQQDALKAEIQELVNAAFDAGRTWQEIADALGVTSKQRVYQIKAGKR